MEDDGDAVIKRLPSKLPIARQSAIPLGGVLPPKPTVARLPRSFWNEPTRSRRSLEAKPQIHSLVRGVGVIEDLNSQGVLFDANEPIGTLCHEPRRGRPL